MRHQKSNSRDIIDSSHFTSGQHITRSFSLHIFQVPTCPLVCSEWLGFVIFWHEKHFLWRLRINPKMQPITRNCSSKIAPLNEKINTVQQLYIPYRSQFRSEREDFVRKWRLFVNKLYMWLSQSNCNSVTVQCSAVKREIQVQTTSKVSIPALVRAVCEMVACIRLHQGAFMMYRAFLLY